MIDKVVHYIITAINQDFDDPNVLDEPQVVAGNMAFIDAYQESSATRTSDKLIASVVNISQESTFRNIPYRKTSTNSDGDPIIKERSPELWLNVYLLFGANRTDYMSALNYISRVIGFFQRKHVFTPAELQNLTGPAVDVNLPEVDKLIFDLCSLNFDQLNQMWSIMGGKYIPSVLYKVRMVLIQESTIDTQKPIEATGFDPNNIEP